MKQLLLSLLLASSCGAAQPVRQAPRPTAAPGEAAKPAGAKKIDAARLLEDARALSADAMEGRGAGTKGGELARAYVERRFTEAGLAPLWATFEQPFDLPSKGRGVNVVGYVKGTKYPERLIVVSAHYDHLGVRGGRVYNGADDNASGVAVLLQLAAHYAGAARPEHSMAFAALDAEELGLVGARELVRRLQAEKRDVALDVNLDMVGHSERGELYASGAYHTPALRPALERVAAGAPVRLLLGHDRPEQGHDDWTNQSDQYAFHKAGIPFVYFGVEDHKDYHKPSDDFDTLTRDFFVGAAETILNSLAALDAELPAGGARK
ncbi:MAG TPA: M28 family peptidase [Pyrinomonadaceae bacterium]|jgi:Zn-dependent M28 family amino/carboxypeptidase